MDAAPVRGEPTMIDRSKGLGASEIPAIAGASPWRTPVEVWMEKVGLATRVDETDQMRTGRDLERAILKLGARDLDRRLVWNRTTFRHPDWPDVPMYATPDGFGPGRESLVEVKVVSHHQGHWKDGPPSYVQLQVQAQMTCLPRARFVDVIALIGGAIRTYRVDRDPELIRNIVHEARAWWTLFVRAETAPPPSTPDDEWALLRARVSIDHHERLATTDENIVGRDLANLSIERARIDALIDEARRTLASTSDGHDVAGIGWAGTWSERASVDWKGVVAAAGVPDEVIGAFTRKTPSFTVRRTVPRGDLTEGEFV